MTEIIKAIETEYAGCRFRSRLEARWAVFFDVWVEVKGALSHAAMVKTLSGVDGLRPFKGRHIQPQLLLLGPVPRPGFGWLHARFDVFHSYLFYQQVYFENSQWLAYAMGTPGCFSPERLAQSEIDTESVRKHLLSPYPDDRLTVDPAVDDAYRAARSARFEFGQRG